jgi:hypothetical protein
MRPREAHWNLEAAVEFAKWESLSPERVHIKDPQARPPTRRRIQWPQTRRGSFRKGSQGVR